MARPATLAFALASCTLAAFGVVADRALDGQLRRAREEARRAGEETARLTALSVRAALASLEERVVPGEPAPAPLLGPAHRPVVGKECTT